MNNQVEQLAKWIKESSYTIVLTGAGMSTESGVPDFRSKAGWWRSIDPLTVATTEALENNYELFREFYQARLKGLDECKPHLGHTILADWEKRGWVQAIATQNVDGFHQQAGSRTVYELHGSIHQIRCSKCHKPTDESSFLQGESCDRCGGELRPGVVLFGELLPEEAWGRALAAVQKAELVLVIGTSLQVYPVAELPSLTRGKVAIINLEEGADDSLFDLALYGKAGVVLERVNQDLVTL